MTLTDFDTWARELLGIDGFGSMDSSLNGIQVERSPGPLTKVAFAVDASAEAIRRANSAGAQVLFVHHGLFWGRPKSLTGALYERIRLLLESDIALYACHLPLDAHPELGNNAVMARLLGLEDLEPFCSYHGAKLGWKGRLPQALPLNQVLGRLGQGASSPLTLIQAGPSLISSVGIVSGGAATDLDQAIAEGLDLFITGSTEHSIYNDAVESGIHFAALGHYATETYGVKAVASRLAKDRGLETIFLDLPTGL